MIEPHPSWIKAKKDAEKWLAKAIKTGTDTSIAELMLSTLDLIRRIGDPMGPIEHAVRVLYAARGEGWDDGGWDLFLAAIASVREGRKSLDDLSGLSERWKAREAKRAEEPVDSDVMQA